MNKCYFGFDTSCYTTSFAVCDSEGNILLNEKKMLNVKEGERGLRQSDAVFQHTVNMEYISAAVARFMRERSDMTLAAVGCSSRPRDIEGSYMPCFLAGVAAAKNVSAVAGSDYYSFSHQAGHVSAALYGSGATDLFEKEFVAFHVSGGTTDILRVVGREGGNLEAEHIGGTRDLNAGQVIDRAGVMMGLPFPAGKHLESNSTNNLAKVPKYKPCADGLECNLSGIENKAEKLFSETNDVPLTSAFVLNAVFDSLKVLTNNVLDRYPGTPIVYSGGVMSCRMIKDGLAGDDRYFAPPEYSSDNAAGIAYLTMKKHKYERSGG